MSNLRNAFIEGELSKMESALGNQFTQELLGAPEIDNLRALMARLAIANIHNGLVTIPNDTGDTIPLLAVKRGDDLKLGPEFSEPNTSQRESYRLQFEELGASPDYASKLSSSLTSPHEQNVTIRSLGDNYAQTVNASVLTTPEGVMSAYGIDTSPGKKMVKFMFRPLIVLSLGNADSDVDLHELKHVQQRIDRPLLEYGSQNDFDMEVLRNEMKAYHVGASVRKGMLRDNPTLGDPFEQIRFDSIRLKANQLFRDPFKPSKMLMQQYRQHAKNGVIEDIPNFEEIQQALSAQL